MGVLRRDVAARERAARRRARLERRARSRRRFACWPSARASSPKAPGRPSLAAALTPSRRRQGRVRRVRRQHRRGEARRRFSTAECPHERARPQRRLVDAQVPARAHGRRAHRGAHGREARARADRAHRRRGDLHARAAAETASSRGSAPMRDLRAAVEYIVAWLASEESGPVIGAVGEIEAVGHRVVHGGERFQRSVRIDDDVLRGIEDMIDLAPLHNPHNLKGDRGRARRVRRRRAARRGVRYRVPPHDPRTRVPLRDSVSAVSAPQGSTLRISRHVASLRRVSLAGADRRVARRHADHHAPPRQRLLGVRDRSTATRSTRRWASRRSRAS